MDNVKSKKYGSLFCLVFQNCGAVLLMRYSRILDGPQALVSIIVVLQELFKLLGSSVLLYHQRRRIQDVGEAFKATKSVSHCNSFFCALQSDGEQRKYYISWQVDLQLLAPCLLFTLQNYLIIVGITNMPAALFHVVYQSKILTAAVFQCLLLGKHLSVQKWTALAVLSLGVACVQLGGSSSSGSVQHQVMVIAVALSTAAFALTYSVFVAVRTVPRVSLQPSLRQRPLGNLSFSNLFTPSFYNKWTPLGWLGFWWSLFLKEDPQHCLLVPKNNRISGKRTSFWQFCTPRLRAVQSQTLFIILTVVAGSCDYSLLLHPPNSGMLLAVIFAIVQDWESISEVCFCDCLLWLTCGRLFVSFQEQSCSCTFMVQNGVFHGFNITTWAVIITNSGGGLLIAVVIVHAGQTDLISYFPFSSLV